MVKGDEGAKSPSEVAERLDDLLSTAIEFSFRIADHLRGGRLSEGYQDLAVLMEALKEACLALTLVTSFMQAGHLRVCLNELQQRFFPELLGALEGRDAVLIADLLEYELPGFLELIQQRLKGMWANDPDN